MATTITSTYLTFDDVLLTCQIKDIDAHTDDEKVAIALYRNVKSGTWLPIFNTIAYPDSSGTVVVSDISDLIEQDMRDHNAQNAVYRIDIGDASQNIQCYYCEYSLPSDADLQESFFTTLDGTLVHADSLISVSYPYLVPAAVPLHVSIFVSYVDVEGRRRVVEQGEDVLSGTLTLSVSSILTAAKAAADELDVPAWDRPLAIYINQGNRMRTYFIDRSPDWQLFRFRNIFNSLEYIEIKGVTTTKTAVTTDSAVVSGVTTLYNHLTTRTYAVETVALLPEMARAIDQLFNSRDCAILDKNGDELPIIITDHTCEISSTDESLQTVKFTWRFADQRPRLLDSDVQSMHPSPGVFDENFGLQYS